MGWLKTSLFLVCACLYASVLTIGRLDVFYWGLSLGHSGGVPVLIRRYGPMHSAFYAMVVLFFAVGLIAIGYSLHRKKQVPRTILYLLVLPEVICVLTFFVVRRIVPAVDFVPLGYVLAELTYLLIARRVNLYDVGDTVIDSMVREGGIGYISFDFRCRYLGSNPVAQQLVPGLTELAVDEAFGYKPSQRQIRHFLDSFRQEPGNTPLSTRNGGRTTARTAGSST